MHAKDYTYPVIENHHAMARCYCPMCGSEVEGANFKGGVNEGGADAAGIDDGATASAAIKKLARLAYYEPQMMKVLALRIERPELTLRETAKTMRLSKSALDEILDRLMVFFPDVGGMLGRLTKASLSQQRRRGVKIEGGMQNKQQNRKERAR